MLKRLLSLLLGTATVLAMLVVPVFAEEADVMTTGLPEGMGDTVVAENEPNDPRLNSFTGKVEGDPNPIENGDTVTGFLWLSSTYPEIRDMWDRFEFTVPQSCKVSIYVITEYGEEDVLNSGFSLELAKSSTTIAEDTVPSSSGESDYPNLYILEEELESGTYIIHLKGRYDSRNRYMLYLFMDICTHKNASKVVVNPTCTKEGYTAYICPDCNTTTKEDYLPALEHAEVIIEGKAPTCTETGLTEGKSCSLCGEILVSQKVVEKKAHPFGEWITDQELTCTEDGLYHRSCSVCPKVEQRETKAVGHSFDQWVLEQELTCTQDRIETRTCTVCGERETKTTVAAGHAYSLVELSAAPGPEKTGLLTKRCPGCTVIETETLPVSADAVYRIPENVTHIGEGAFGRQRHLTGVIFPDGLISIGPWAFDCTSLASLTFPDSLTGIGELAFRECSALTSVTFGNGSVSIGEYAFQMCDNLTEVTFGDGDTHLDSGAFLRCGSLTNVIFGDGAVSIGELAFEACENLSNVTFGNGPVSIGRYAFSYSEKLNGVTFGDGAVTIGEGAFSSKLSSVTFGNGETNLSEKAFENCTGLKSVTFGEGQINIGAYAFRNTGLTQITIPAGVESIDFYAFNNSDLEKISFIGYPPELSDYCLYDLTVTAYYPADDPSWTQEVRDKVQGNITWIACDHDFAGDSCGSLGACKNCGARWYTHSYAEATCTAPQTCTECGVSKGEALGHQYQDGMCGNCGGYRPGDVDRNRQINQIDVTYLFWHTLFPDLYPVQEEADFSGDRKVTDEDALLLLWHVLFPTDNHK